jgi:hypothetical protein
MPTIVRCIYCGVADPDIKSICPDTHTTHVLVSASDKQTQGQGYGPGPGSDNSPYEREKMNQTKSKEAGLSRSLGHGFAQTDTVKHCPFCGSGDVWGGSDGTVSCEFCSAVFQVSVEPAYPSAPGSIDGNPLNMEGDPDAMGQADGGDGWAGAEGVAAGQQGMQPGMPGEEVPPGEEGDDGGGGPPWAQGGEDEEPPPDEEPQGGGGSPPFPPKKKSSLSYLTYQGDPLSEELYLKHLAIRHAVEVGSLLVEMRHTSVMVAAQDPVEGTQAEYEVPERDHKMAEHLRDQHLTWSTSTLTHDFLHSDEACAIVPTTHTHKP